MNFLFRFPALDSSSTRLVTAILPKKYYLTRGQANDADDYEHKLILLQRYVDDYITTFNNLKKLSGGIKLEETDDAKLDIQRYHNALQNISNLNPTEEEVKQCFNASQDQQAQQSCILELRQKHLEANGLDQWNKLADIWKGCLLKDSLDNCLGALQDQYTDTIIYKPLMKNANKKTPLLPKFRNAPADLAAVIPTQDRSAVYGIILANGTIYRVEPPIEFEGDVELNHAPSLQAAVDATHSNSDIPMAPPIASTLPQSRVPVLTVTTPEAAQQIHDKVSAESTPVISPEQVEQKIQDIQPQLLKQEKQNPSQTSTVISNGTEHYPASVSNHLSAIQNFDRSQLRPTSSNESARQATIDQLKTGIENEYKNEQAQENIV